MKAAALVLVLCLQASPGDQDVVHLKDGTSRAGRIVSETDRDIALETLIKGSKGQVVGTVKVTILKTDVSRVERASAEARRLAEERSKAFGERGIRRAEALAKIKPVEVRFEGLKGYQVTGTHFILESSGDPTFVKDVAVCLEEVFAAYRRFFDVRRNADRKIKVTVFADRIEYDLYNLRRIGGTTGAVAYYRVPDNTIVAYNLIQRDKEHEVRAEILRAQNDIEKFRTQAQAVERQVVELVQDLRKRIQDEAFELRKQIRNDGQGNKDARLQEIDRLEKAAMDELREGKSGAQKELQDARRKATEAIEQCRQNIEHNEKVLAGQNRGMFETLFHEGFHAFASNFLWEGSGQKEFPRWLHEGMACYFEMSVVEAGSLVHGAVHAEFLKLLREKVLLRTLLPVEKLLRGGAEMFQVTHATEVERRTASYAQSWALAHYLAGKVSREQIEIYVTDILVGHDGVQAFEQMVGKKCAQVDQELRAHLEGLK